MLNFVCVKWGAKYSASYVNILVDMIRRNLAEGHPGRFVCFTDDPTGIEAGIDVRPLPVPELTGWWHKLSLFKAGVFPDGDRIVYFDLDTVITGRLDEIVAYQGPFAILRDAYRPDGWQSAIMAWRAGWWTALWEMWDAAGRPQTDAGDQAWIQHALPIAADLWQRLYPDLFVSYKLTDGVVPSTASVVVFHGEPRPHEVVTGWVPQVWMMGGLSRAALDVISNTRRDVYMAQVRENCARDLPWIDVAPRHDRHVAIVGGAPSLQTARHELHNRQRQGQEIWALNGAFDWLACHGIIPTAHVIIDARPANVTFLIPRRSCVYYLASQCHPSLFDRLAGFDVRVLHCLTDGMEDYLRALDTTKPTHLLGGGTTVAMKALVLAHELGYRHRHLYGVDSSYTQAAHHAYPQPGNDGERVLTALFGDQSYSCAPWMVTQASDFQSLIPYLTEDGGEITVHGTGLLPAIAHAYMQHPYTAAQVRAQEILRRMPPDALGAEIGVFNAALSVELLTAAPRLRMVLVDSWTTHDATSPYAQTGDYHAALTQAEQDDLYTKTLARLAPFRDRVTVLRQASVDAARAVRDRSLDFVFLDADHSYEGCAADLAAWGPKVKPGGWLGGHDYDHPSFPKFGVTQAVTDYAGTRPVALGNNYTWFMEGR